MPDRDTEMAILAACRERDPLRAHGEGPLAGLARTAEWLVEDPSWWWCGKTSAGT